MTGGPQIVQADITWYGAKCINNENISPPKPLTFHLFAICFQQIKLSEEIQQVIVLSLA